MADAISANAMATNATNDGDAPANHAASPPAPLET